MDASRVVEEVGPVNSRREFFFFRTKERVIGFFLRDERTLFIESHNLWDTRIMGLYEPQVAPLS